MSRRRAFGPLAVAGLIAGFVAVYGYTCAVKYAYYLYRDFDLAIFAQATDGILHGSTFSSIRGMAWLGDHASLVLYLIAPIYAIAQHPLTLLLLQAMALAIGAIPIYRIARRELASEAAAVACAAAYLLYPAIGYVALFEFHPEALAPAALLFAFDSALAGRTARTLLFAALAITCREDVALVVLGMATHAWFSRHPRRMVLAPVLTGLAAASLFVSFGVLRPLFLSGQAEYAGMYATWGTSPLEIADNVLRNPIAAMRTLFETPGDPLDTLLKQQYYLHLLMPLAFLPLLSPATLAIALPILAEHMLASRQPQHTIVYQYAALTAPWFVVAAVLGLRNLLRLVPRARVSPVRATFVALAVACSIVSSVVFGPFGLGRLQRAHAVERTRPTAYDRAMKGHRDSLLSRLPEGPAIASFEFLARLANRDSVHSLHHVLSGTYTFSSRPYPMPLGVQSLLADWSDEQVLAYLDRAAAERLRAVRVRNDLAPSSVAGDLVLFTRAPRDTVEGVSAADSSMTAPADIRFQGLTFLGCDPATKAVRPGESIRIPTYWRRDGAIEGAIMTELGWFDANGAQVASHARDLGNGLDPPLGWPLGRIQREATRIVVPDLQPGRYVLAMRLRWRSGARPDRPVPAVASGPAATPNLGTVEVLARAR